MIFTFYHHFDGLAFSRVIPSRLLSLRLGKTESENTEKCDNTPQTAIAILFLYVNATRKSRDQSLQLISISNV